MSLKDLEIVSLPKFDWLAGVIKRQRKTHIRANEDFRDEVWWEIAKIFIPQEQREHFRYARYFSSKKLGSYFKNDPSEIYFQLKASHFTQPNSFQSVIHLINYLDEQGIELKITTLHINVDYKYSSLLPFKNLPFQNFSKGTEEIPIRRRLNANNKQYKVFNSVFELTFYDKSQEIRDNKREASYPPRYLTEQIYRMELKLKKHVEIDFSISEFATGETKLREFYLKH